ncbi:MAG: YerC/YecD family TrpR-related protein, partial [Oscillospiraceae bacterium]
KAISQRLHVAKLLTERRVYNEIVKETGASTATISRVNKTLNYQAAGGYKIVFDRLKDEK